MVRRDRRFGSVRGLREKSCRCGLLSSRTATPSALRVRDGYTRLSRCPNRRLFSPSQRRALRLAPTAPPRIVMLFLRGEDLRVTSLHDDVERATFLQGLELVFERFELGLVSYTLMGNHYHLIAHLEGAAAARQLVLAAAQPRAGTGRAPLSGALLRARDRERRGSARQLPPPRTKPGRSWARAGSVRLAVEQRRCHGRPGTRGAGARARPAAGGVRRAGELAGPLPGVHRKQRSHGFRAGRFFADKNERPRLRGPSE